MDHSRRSRFRDPRNLRFWKLLSILPLTSSLPWDGGSNISTSKDNRWCLNYRSLSLILLISILTVVQALPLAFVYIKCHLWNWIVFNRFFFKQFLILLPYSFHDFFPLFSRCFHLIIKLSNRFLIQKFKLKRRFLF